MINNSNNFPWESCELTVIGKAVIVGILLIIVCYCAGIAKIKPVICPAVSRVDDWT